MSRTVVIFDMDGVLVDVSESYRETIRRTVEHFTGAQVAHEEIQDWKNRGGWNDDWELSRALIATRGRELSLEEVTAYFQQIFHGENGDGLMLRERWIGRGGLMEDLALRFGLAVFTGRTRWEAELTLRRFAPEIAFDPVVGSDDVPRHKPAPDGLLHIRGRFPDAALWYVGDTVDDARASRAAAVPFIGIAAPDNPRHGILSALLRDEGAIAVLDDINALPRVLPA